MDKKALQSLKEKALNATPGPWKAEHEMYISNGMYRFYGHGVSNDDDILLKCERIDNAENNAEYLAAVSPEVILELIAMVEGKYK